jgi:UDP-N-acetylmuramoylalanine--D-glutamate ligase
MIPITTFAGRTVAVFGLGSSGVAAAQALVAGGASVAAWDDGEAGRAGATQAGVPLVDLAAADWSRFAALILAPGVPLTHPEPHWTVQKAKAAGVEVIGDMELFFRERAKAMSGVFVVGITGTNGKSTTTALTAHLLREAGFKVSMGGNIGRPVLDLEPLESDRVYVLEMSSFQIDLTPSLSCSAAALINLTPDHLDRHGTMANYVLVKSRILDDLGPGVGYAVLGSSDDFCRRIAAAHDQGTSSVITVALPGEPRRSMFAERSRLYMRDDEGVDRLVANLEGVATLRGLHNWQNAMVALALAIAVPLTARLMARDDFSELGDVDELLPRFTAALRSYPGLPHRMEQVGTLEKPGGRVDFINDSKATNADSTDKALASWDGGIHLILGGKPKEGGITSLAPFFPRIAKAYLIGLATDEFAATLEGKVSYERCGALDKALDAATRDALSSPAAEPVVLLSPACASYDQFKSFEHRGNEFRRLVQAIPGVTTPS